MLQTDLAYEWMKCKVDKGCKIWGLYREQDAKFTPDDQEFHDEMHKVCYLMGGDWGIAAAQVNTWVSDTLGPVLL